MPRDHRSTSAYQEALRVAADIDRQGYATLPDFVSQDELEPLRSIARVGAQQSRGEYFYRTRLTDVSGTVLAELAQSVCFKNFCKDLYEIATGDTAPEANFYFVFRCLQGASGQRHSYQFHYDSHTMRLLPMPGSPDSSTTWPSPSCQVPALHQEAEFELPTDKLGQPAAVHRFEAAFGCRHPLDRPGLDRLGQTLDLVPTECLEPEPIAEQPSCSGDVYSTSGGVPRR
jgi:hypothetical protein